MTELEQPNFEYQYECPVSVSYNVHDCSTRRVTFNVMFDKTLNDLLFYLEAKISEQDINSQHYDVQGNHRICMTVEEMSNFANNGMRSEQYGGLKFTLDVVNPPCIYLEYAFHTNKHPIPIRLTVEDYKKFTDIAKFVLKDIQMMENYLNWDGKETRILTDKRCLWNLFVAYLRSQLQNVNRVHQTKKHVTELLEHATTRGFESFLYHSALSISRDLTIDEILSLNHDIITEVLETIQPPTYSLFIHNRFCCKCSKFADYDQLWAKR